MTRHLIEWVSEWDSKRIRLETFESISPFFENQFWLKTMQRRHDTMTTMMTKKVWQNKQKLLNSRLCLTHTAGRLVASDRRRPRYESSPQSFYYLKNNCLLSTVPIEKLKQTKRDRWPTVWLDRIQPNANVYLAMRLNPKQINWRSARSGIGSSPFTK